MHRAELVFAGDLSRLHRSLDVLNAVDLRRDRFILEVAALRPRLVVRGTAVGSAQRDARALAYKYAGIRQATEQSAHVGGSASKLVQRNRRASGTATTGERAFLIRANLLTVGVRAGDEIANTQAEYGVAAAEGKRRGTVRRSRSPPRCPHVAEGINQEVLVALVEGKA